MFIKDINFQVEFSDFAEKHFCKAFSKKYKKKWLATRNTIKSTLQRSYNLFRETNLIDHLRFSQEDDIGIFKLDFKVAGTNFGPKTSGNRVVFALCNQIGGIEILLVYGKINCSNNQNETQWVLEHIKNNFPQYKKYCK